MSSHWDAYRYFERHEFECSCGCGRAEMDPAFVALLDRLRGLVGRPLTITSGFRCSSYDQKYGGKGNHNTGLAADLATANSTERYELVLLAAFMGIDRIGVGRDFVHLDMVPHKPHPVLWTY